MKARILWVEGKRADGPSFVPDIRKKDILVETVPNGGAALRYIAEYKRALQEARAQPEENKAALEHAMELKPHLMVVNAASFRTNGARICQDLRKSLDGVPIVLITKPGQAPPKDTSASILLTLPFTPRKLINQIMPLLPTEGESQSRELHAGPIRLNLDKKQARIHRKKVHLTPRLTRLLQTFMQHPGEVIQRDQLFRDLWDTEYVKDTRTLDVHISWLRKAIEEDPRHPVFLKTIRGMGYRLDV